jgi:hypothetical protein
MASDNHDRLPRNQLGGAKIGEKLQAAKKEIGKSCREAQEDRVSILAGV